jgi:hypothetical protein
MFQLTVEVYYLLTEVYLGNAYTFVYRDLIMELAF